MLSIIFATLLATIALPAAAQVTEDEGLWVNMTGQGATHGGTLYFLELQPRVHGRGRRLDQYLVRGAVGRRVSGTLTLHQGYAHVFVPLERRGDVNEERSFQQVGWILPGRRRGELSLRTRFEQRWRSDGSDVGLRLRQMARFEHPLSRGAGGVRALASTELFWAMNKPDWRPRAGFDQLRTFLGVEVPIAGASTIEAGYLNQTVDDIGRRVTMNHLLALSLFLRR